MMRPLIKFVLLACSPFLVLMTLAAAGRGELLIAESFDYEIGDLDGNGGGLGFGDSWVVNSDFRFEVDDPGRPLQYQFPGGGLISGGDRALLFINDTDDLVLGNETEALLREFAEPIETDEVFFSFLYRYDENGFIDNNDFVVWWFNDPAGPQVGLKGNGGDGSRPDDIVARVDNNFRSPQQAFVPDVDISDEAGTIGEDFFIVMRMSKEGNSDDPDDYDQADVWVNPAMGDLGDPMATAIAEPDNTPLLPLALESIGLRAFSQEPGDGMWWDELRIGTTWNDVLAPIGGGGGSPGDFDGDGQLDADDIDALTRAVIANETDARFDVSGDGSVNQADREFWVANLRKTWFGDANLDGVFNTADLLTVFQAGEYEDAVDRNSTWATGDWDGDLDFSTSDLIKAFQDAGFEQGPRASTAAVPEPFGFAGVIIGLVLVAIRQRQTV